MRVEGFWDLAQCSAVVANPEKRGCTQKSPDWPSGARNANGTALHH
jgi:hypothetical protein